LRRRPLELPQLDDAVELLEGLARILMSIDARLRAIVDLLEDE